MLNCIVTEYTYIANINTLIINDSLFDYIKLYYLMLCYIILLQVYAYTSNTNVLIFN